MDVELKQLVGRTIERGGRPPRTVAHPIDMIVFEGRSVGRCDRYRGHIAWMEIIPDAVMRKAEELVRERNRNHHGQSGNYHEYDAVAGAQ